MNKYKYYIINKYIINKYIINKYINFIYNITI